ncbi:hypothetical protein C8J57DRAFT_1210760 [Mycena rebaudengoi]|nr:hypothetical protein C8J57DRAFT_1210760 [Mycena rebaudengoi]
MRPGPSRDAAQAAVLFHPPFWIVSNYHKIVGRFAGRFSGCSFTQMACDLVSVSMAWTNIVFNSGLQGGRGFNTVAVASWVAETGVTSHWLSRRTKGASEVRGGRGKSEGIILKKDSQGMPETFNPPELTSGAVRSQGRPIIPQVAPSSPAASPKIWDKDRPCFMACFFCGNPVIRLNLSGAGLVPGASILSEYLANPLCLVFCC